MHNKNTHLWFPIALVFYEITTYLSNDMYLPSLPEMKADLGLSQDMAQYTLLSWFLGSASMQLAVGPLADRFGRKSILLISGLLFIVSTFLCAMTTNVDLFLLARFAQGVAVCAVIVAGYAAIHELYDSVTAIKIIAVMGSITILAPALGPSMGALMVQGASWRAIFYFLALWALIGVLLLAKVMPETLTNKVALDIKDIAKDYFIIATRRKFLRYMLPFCLLFMSFICWVVETPFIVIETYHQSALTYGIIQLFVFGSFIIGAQLTRLAIHYLAAEKVIQLGLWISILAAFALLGVTFSGSHWYFIVIVMVIMSLGSSLAFGPLNRSAIDTCQEPMGRVLAIFASYMSLFGVIGTWLVTLFNDKTMDNLTLLIAIGVILAFLSFYLLKKDLTKG